MLEFNNLAKRILAYGEERIDRTGTGTISCFGEKMSFNLLLGLPVVTGKKISWKLPIKELLWMLSGSSSNTDLNNKGVTIWDEWAVDGNLGPVYGSQWRNWPVTDYEYHEDDIIMAGREMQLYGSTNALDGYSGHIDQITLLLDGLQNRPFSRRHIITAWNWAFIPQEDMTPQENVLAGNMCLPPCHIMAQWYVSKATYDDKINYASYQKYLGVVDFDIDSAPEYKLSCQMYQRSMDVCLGAPFNMIGYSVLTMMLAKQCGFMPGMYHHVIGDAHVYLNHVDNLKIQLSREPFSSPFLRINDNVKSIFDYKIEDFDLIGYKHHAPLSYSVAV
ncbi:thymidylate synthase [Candidatus Woesebacteria bacterium]|nr:thymidylate synthase [Candidatus Woesebacteria bacterium]